MNNPKRSTNKGLDQDSNLIALKGKINNLIVAHQDKKRKQVKWMIQVLDKSQETKPILLKKSLLQLKTNNNYRVIIILIKHRIIDNQQVYKMKDKFIKNSKLLVRIISNK